MHIPDTKRLINKAYAAAVSETSFPTRPIEGATIGGTGGTAYTALSMFHSEDDESVKVENGFHGLSSGGTAIEQVTLTWENINVGVKVKGSSQQSCCKLPFRRKRKATSERKQILKNGKRVCLYVCFLARLRASLFIVCLFLAFEFICVNDFMPVYICLGISLGLVIKIPGP